MALENHEQSCCIDKHSNKQVVGEPTFDPMRKFVFAPQASVAPTSASIWDHIRLIGYECGPSSRALALPLGKCGAFLLTTPRCWAPVVIVRSPKSTQQL